MTKYTAVAISQKDEPPKMARRVHSKNSLLDRTGGGTVSDSSTTSSSSHPSSESKTLSWIQQDGGNFGISTMSLASALALNNSPNKMQQQQLRGAVVGPQQRAFHQLQPAPLLDSLSCPHSNRNSSMEISQNKPQEQHVHAHTCHIRRVPSLLSQAALVCKKNKNKKVNHHNYNNSKKRLGLSSNISDVRLAMLGMKIKSISRSSLVDKPPQMVQRVPSYSEQEKDGNRLNVSNTMETISSVGSNCCAGSENVGGLSAAAVSCPSSMHNFVWD